MNGIILQVCTDTGLNHMLNFEFLKGIGCTYINSAGLLVAGLLLYGGINFSIFIRTGDVRIPVVLTLLTGGVIIPQIAAPGVAVASIALLLTGAGSLTYMYYKYSI